MSADSGNGLGTEYSDLYGDELLDRLVADRRTAVLEAMWRLREPACSTRLAGRLAALSLPGPGALLLDEIVAPTLGEEIAGAVVKAVRNHWPLLPESRIRDLSARLRDEQPLSGTYETHREVLQSWLLRLPGPSADEYALDVVLRDLAPEPSDGVRTTALHRCQEDPAVGEQAALRLEEVLTESASATTWAQAHEFVAVMTGEQGVSPDYLERLVFQLVELAVAHSTVDAFATGARRAIQRHAAPLVVKLLAGDEELSPSTPGALALARLTNALGRSRDRQRAFINLIRSHPGLWRAVGTQILEDWEEETWRDRLDGVLKIASELEQDVLAGLIRTAPSSLSPLLMRVAIAHGEDPEVHAATAERVAARLSDLQEAQAEGGDAVWWPGDEAHDVHHRVALILEQAIPDAERRCDLTTRAIERGAVQPKSAASLVPPGQFRRALEATDQGKIGQDLCTALFGRDTEEAERAVREIQEASGWSRDLAEAAAPHAPMATFAGATDSWSELDVSDKDAMIELLHQYGRTEEMPLLNLVLSDTVAGNSDRRVMAAERVGELTPEGGSIPDGVIGLLNSARPELIAAGAKVVGVVKPEDPSLLRELRALAIEGNEEASDAVEGVAETFLSRLDGNPEKTMRIRLLELIAACGRGPAIPALMAHVGPDALDDDPAVRRAAAMGLRELSELVELDSDELSSLAELVNGERRERDREALDMLSSALARATLGEHAALRILLEMLPSEPTTALHVLLGSEARDAVTHLQLYASEDKRGEAGWGGVITQLDLVAERLLRAAYLKFGGSESIKEQIRSSRRAPDYGALIGATTSVRGLQGAQGDLQTLHTLRSENTQQPHVGERPTQEIVDTAKGRFRRAATVLIGMLDRAAQSPE